MIIVEKDGILFLIDRKNLTGVFKCNFLPFRWGSADRNRERYLGVDLYLEAPVNLNLMDSSIHKGYLEDT